MRVPDYKYVSGGNTRVNMNPSASSQSGRAFAKMGEDLASVGIQVSGVFEKAAKIHDDGEMIKLQQELDEMYSGYDKQMLETPNDVMKWREGWDKLTSKKQFELDSRDMSNDLRQRANQFASNYYSKRGISISGNQHRTVVGNTQKSARSYAKDLYARGKYDEYDNFVGNSVQNNILPQHEGDEMMAASSRQRDEDALRKEMEDNPPLFQKNYNEGKYQNSNIHPDRVAQMYSDAVKREEAQQVDAYKDIDSSSYPSVEAIRKDERYAKLSPKQQINVEKSYYDKQNLERATYYQDTKNYDEIQGKQESLIRKIDDGKISRVDGVSLLRSNQKFVNDPQQKARYEEQINRIEADEKFEIKTQADYGENIINLEFDSHEDNNPKPKPAKMTRKKAIMLDPNFFTKKNLKAYGIKDKYIDDIIEAKADVGGKGIDISGRDKQEVLSAKMDAFEALLEAPHAIDSSVTLTDERQKIRDSILAGQPSDVMSSYISAKETADWTEKQIQINSDRSKALKSFRQFMRINPKADDKSILKHIRGEEKMIRSNSGSSIISAPPSRMTVPVGRIEPDSNALPSGARVGSGDNPLLTMETEDQIREDLQNAGVIPQG